MLTSMRNILKVPDLRTKILFTIAVLGLYRLGSQVPVPGIDFDAVLSLSDSADQTGGVLSILNLFSGGALTRFAIFAIGILPYITASIIMQILTVAIPKLEEWQQQGAVGQRKITQWTRYLTLLIAFLQATGITFVFGRGGGGALGNTTGIIVIPDFQFARVMLVIISLTAGTALLMWMGELISQRGVGNGMSLLIFASVVSSLPFDGARLQATEGNIYLGGAIIVAIGLMVAIIFIEQGQRRIPVQFAKRQVGRRQYGGQSTYIPLKVNQSGVIPHHLCQLGAFPTCAAGQCDQRQLVSEIHQRPADPTGQPGVHHFIRFDDRRVRVLLYRDHIRSRQASRQHS